MGTGPDGIGLSPALDALTAERHSPGSQPWHDTSSLTLERSPIVATTVRKALHSAQSCPGTYASMRGIPLVSAQNVGSASATATNWLGTRRPTLASGPSAAKCAVVASASAPICSSIGGCTQVSAPTAARSAVGISAAAPTCSSTSGCTSCSGNNKGALVQSSTGETPSSDKALTPVRRSGNTNGLQTHRMGKGQVSSRPGTMRDNQAQVSSLRIIKTRRSWSSVWGSTSLVGAPGLTIDTMKPASFLRSHLGTRNSSRV